MNDVDVDNTIRSCKTLKPKNLFISDLKWKYLVRAVLRGKNILIIGPSGCAKTMAVKCVAEALKRPFQKFNCGSTQDARATLIGNMTYKKETGTVFNRSAFIRSITTPNSIVLLDELTRGTHDAWNILMTVTDPLQRYVRLDEDDEGTVIQVAEGVCFIATANIGNEYTATKVLDKAIARRFPIKLEMEPLSSEEMKELFAIQFHGRTDEEVKLMETLTDIYGDLIAQSKLEETQISNIIPPANMIELGELVMDGFVLEEIAEAAVYPEYVDPEEKTFVKSIVQQYIPNNAANPVRDPRKPKP